jgi:hypothetical protein
LYEDLAGWWPLLSPPTEFEDEAADLLPRLRIAAGSRPATLLELGAGGSSLAFHLKHQFRLTLTDRSPAMLAVSREVNDTYTVDYAVEGLFGRAQWLEWLAGAGLPARTEGDPWGRDVFIATRSGNPSRAE